MSETANPYPRLAHMLDADNLHEKGPTLKNVAENMRTVAVLITLLVAAVTLLHSKSVLVVVGAVIWGLWTIFYAILATLQSAMLFALGLTRIRWLRYLMRRSTLALSVISYTAAGVALLFMASAIAMLVLDTAHLLANDPLLNGVPGHACQAHSS